MKNFTTFNHTESTAVKNISDELDIYSISSTKDHHNDRRNAGKGLIAISQNWPLWADHQRRAGLVVRNPLKSISSLSNKLRPSKIT